MTCAKQAATCAPARPCVAAPADPASAKTPATIEANTIPRALALMSLSLRGRSVLRPESIKRPRPRYSLLRGGDKSDLRLRVRPSAGDLRDARDDEQCSHHQAEHDRDHAVVG